MVQRIKERTLYRQTVDRFINYLSRVYKRKTEYRCNAQDVTAWNNWVEYYGKSVGRDLAWKYLDYGFQSWFNADFDSETHAIRFSWIYGKPAIKRWEKLGQKLNVEIAERDVKAKYKLYEVEVFGSRLRATLTAVRPFEEQFRGQYLNTKRGLANCVANTTLYQPNSPTCKLCKVKSNCKAILKRNYPRVYKARDLEQDGR